MKLILSVFILLWFCVYPKSAEAQDDYIKKNVTEVYEKIINAIGDLNSEPPQLEIIDTKSHVAIFNSTGIIRFERAAYLVCTKSGKDSLDAVAYILAHELGHYYRHHSWMKEAGSAYASLEIGDQIKKAKGAFDEVREADADEFACFYSKLAGYSLNRTDLLLQNIYKAYGFPDALPNYPILHERIAIAEKVKVKANEMGRIYDLANMNLVCGQYEISEYLYRMVIRNKFGSREIFNNLGLSLALSSLEYFDETTKSLVLPFELDPYSRLKEEQTRSYFIDNMPKADSLLKEAIKQFEKAYILDKTYYTACLNLAVCYALIKDDDEKEIWLKRASKINPALSPDSQQYQYIQAIFLFLSGKEEEATMKIGQLAKESYIPAKVTQQLLTNTNSYEDTGATIPCLQSRLFIRNYKLMEKETEDSFNNTKVQIFRKDSLQHRFTVIQKQDSNGKNRMNFHFAEIANDTTLKCLTEDVGGDPYSIISKLGPPAKVYSFLDQQYLVWDTLRIMVISRKNLPLNWYYFGY